MEAGSFQVVWHHCLGELRFQFPNKAEVIDTAIPRYQKVYVLECTEFRVLKCRDSAR
jgi:hypothetical protein